MDAQDWLK
jgi:hypothetical protein